MKRIFALICIFCLLLSGCTAQKAVKTNYKQNTTGVWNIDESPLNGLPLKEDKAIYKNDADSKITELYLTVKAGKNDRLQPIYTFDMLNSFTGEGEQPFCEVIFQEGKDGNGPSPGMFAFGETMVNGKLETMGNISTIKKRSYQIKLYDRAGLWNSVRTINLSKELPDLSRMKNKLGFDTVEQLSDVVGMRTRFMHVYVKDLSQDVKADSYEDMGLFTYIEQPNKAYLSARDMDTDGNLYKAKNFNFSRNKDALRLADDEKYNKELFESVLSIREGKDHQKLIKMLDELNDYSVDIDTVIKKYFNEQNLLSFAALQIAYSNYRLMYDNYLIYSPQNANTWYLIPADFGNILEGGTGAKSDIMPDDFTGLPMLFDNVLFRRYFSKPENIEKLKVQMQTLHGTLNGNYVSSQIKKYKPSVLPLLYSMPDLISLPKSAEYVEDYLRQLPELLEKNYSNFSSNIEHPVPPYISKTDYIRGEGTLSASVEWLPSTQDATYTVELARDTNFLNIVYTGTDLTGTSLVIPNLEQGLYYVRVIAKMPDGNTEKCANIYRDNYGSRYYGLEPVIVG